MYRGTVHGAFLSVELGQLKRFSRELIKTKKGVNLLNQNLQNHQIPKKEKRKILMKMNDK